MLFLSAAKNNGVELKKKKRKTVFNIYVKKLYSKKKLYF